MGGEMTQGNPDHVLSEANVRATASAESLAAMTTLRLGAGGSLSLDFLKARSRPEEIADHLAHGPDRQEQRH